MAAALEAINGLTTATETANQLAKAASGVTEIIGKALANIVNLFIQPLAPLMIYLLQKLVLAWTAFKEWWDNLPKWIDENLFKPVKEWIDKWILTPLKNAWKWIDEHIIQPFLAGVALIKQWLWDTFTYWETLLENIPAWLDDNITKPFWAAISNISKWIDDNITKPFWRAVSSVEALVDSHITQPFWKMVKDVSGWIKTYISDPFWTAINTITGYLGSFIGSVTLAMKSVVNTIIGAINWLLDQIRTLANKVGLGSIVPADLPPWLDTGGYVQETGIAVVHKGETVTPAGKGGNITINFYGYQDDKFVQKVKDVLRSQGTVYNL